MDTALPPTTTRRRDSGCCRASRAWWGAVLLPLALGLPARAGASGSSLAERVGLDGRPASSNGASWRVTQDVSEPLAAGAAVTPADALRGDRADQVRQTMLWREHDGSRLGWGVGVEQRGPVAGPYSDPSYANARQPSQNGAALVGVSLATSERSRLTVQTPLLNSANVTSSAYTGAYPGIQDDPALAGQRQVRVGLVFNSKKPLSDLRQGLRTEVNAQTTVALKLRGGRLGFAFSKVW